jgi:hypothetical protein
MSRTRKREIVKRKRNKEKKQKKKIDIYLSLYLFWGENFNFFPNTNDETFNQKMSYRMLADMASIPVKKPATTIWREIGLLIS